MSLRFASGGLKGGDTVCALPSRKGLYIARPVHVWALAAVEKAYIAVEGVLAAQPGDRIVQYGKNEYGVVKAELFERLHEILEARTVTPSSPSE